MQTDIRVGYTEMAFMPVEQALMINMKALDLWREHGIRRDGESSLGGRSFYYVFDGFQVTELFPELNTIYEIVRDQAEDATGLELLLSPWPRSAINVKVYTGPGNGQGWHRDTNPVTGLLYLSRSGTPTEICGLDAKTYWIQPEPGKLVVLHGKACVHRVLPSDQESTRVVFNLYTAEDRARPDWIDRSIYANAPTPSVLH